MSKKSVNHSKVKKAIKNLGQNAIREKLFPGCVVGVLGRDRKKIIIPCGHFTYDEVKKVNKNSVYDLASITKVIPTTSLVLYLIDKGKVRVEDLLSDYIPEITTKYKDKIKIKHLLSQTLYFSKGAQLSKLKNLSPSKIIDKVINFELANKPGEFYASVNTNSILLTVLIERVFKDTLDRVADDILFKPLNMRHTTFFPLEAFNEEDIVPTEYDEWRGKLIQGEVHDESTWVISREKVVGASGLFSNITDLLNFIEMLLNKGTYNGKTIFRSPTVEMIYKTKSVSDIANSGLGWDLNRKTYMGKRSGKYTIGKTGFTGTCIVCDVPRQIGLVILSNHIYPERPSSNRLRNKFFRNVSDVVLDSAGKLK